MLLKLPWLFLFFVAFQQFTETNFVTLIISFRSKIKGELDMTYLGKI